MTQLDHPHLSSPVPSDAPPSYDDVISSYSNLPNTNIRFQPRKKSFFSPLEEGRNWAAMAYLILWDLPYACFCFGWVIGSFIGGFCSLIFPPVGYVILLFSVYSWRMLARLEIAILNSISSPSDIALSTHTPLPSITRVSPQILFSNMNQYHHVIPSGRFEYLFSLLKDRFTIRAVIYFVFTKLLISIIVFTLAITLFALGISFMLCLLPFCLRMSRLLVKLEARMVRKCLLD
ncbi:2101_t:CDS:2 [Diversispora eburnea]|uniref:2101_t:CDS:1 n=1 Tax=Diversispora eburnea TaxID=1213867 RepID=A0A9N9FNH4_9GLOM|nr:2101_t:CDS:2 [Diversispora eburnea]